MSYTMENFEEIVDGFSNEELIGFIESYETTDFGDEEECLAEFAFADFVTI